MADDNWKRLKIKKGKSSYSQERIWLDESIRATYTSKDENLLNYNSVLVYQVNDGYLSINRFRQAIENVLSKNEIFGTELDFDLEEHSVQQKINPFNKDIYSFEITTIDVTDHDKINEIIYKEQMTKHFDLNKGHIFRYHLLKQNQKEKNRLAKDDYVLLVFHHSAIDHHSKYLFVKQLTQEYTNEKSTKDENQLRFIDFAHYERQSDLSKAEAFWEDLFHDYDFHLRINLPYDNKMIFISSGSYYAFDIDASLTRQIFRYKQKMNINFFRLFLSVFYCYLFKLTQDEDFSVVGVTPNRPKKELTSVIGPFENYVVYRHVIDPHQSFNEFVAKIDELCTNIKENAAYPYQNLIAFARKCGSPQQPFSQVALRVDIDDDKWILDVDQNLVLNQIPLTNHREFPRNTKLTPIDLTLVVRCNLENKSIDFYFDYAEKLFEQKTIELLADRFKKILKHLFDVSSNFDLNEEQLFKLSIILPHEEMLIHNINPPRRD
ncbi:unnamed protein product [Adineta ricciae]|uniref:Condensation domain-containing protein n=1 Tax=Adineta ricciae TaxID=249248 RepID=A0A816BK55_ADIRI|nr:unnamed protein product [Adineta ricciae]